MTRLTTLVLMLAVVVLAALIWAFPVRAAKSQRFVVGQTYMVVWACFPVQSAQPCYVEALTVQAVHEDGWLDVLDEQEIKATGKSNLYTINPAQMMAFSLKQASRQASR